LTFDNAIKFCVDARELLIVPLDRSPQLAHLSIHFADFLLNLRHIGSTVVAQHRHLLFEAKHLVGEFTPARLTERLGYWLIKLGHRQGLRLYFVFVGALRASIQKSLDLVPASDQKKQTPNPRGQFHRVRIHVCK
jgi:hypothetical protein